MMETLGFKSAIMVSSPCHMRRIKMITALVMTNSNNNHTDSTGHKNDSNGNFRINAFAFISTRFEKPPGGFRFLKPNELQDIVQESAKIIRFVLYSRA
jgi:hypothetical protein